MIIKNIKAQNAISTKGANWITGRMLLIFWNVKFHKGPFILSVLDGLDNIRTVNFNHIGDLLHLAPKKE